MLSHLLKRQPAKVNGPQCSEKCRERKIVFCDWGFHGRSANDGWEFTLVDEVDLDPEENLDEYPQLPPSECADTISKFAKSQLKKNCRLKSSKGWQFSCLIEDGKHREIPVRRRDRTPRTMLLFEREVPCTCDGSHRHEERVKYCRPVTPEKKEFPDTFELELSLSKTPSPPPRYRRRLSTMATLYEDEGVY